MPLQYAIYAQERLVVTTGSEVVTFAEAIAHQQRLKGDPEFRPEYDQLLDLRQTKELAMTSEQARSLAQGTLFLPSSKRAVVAPDLAIFGMSRMLQTYHGLGEQPSESGVFRDMNEAMEWLGRESIPASQR